MHIVSRKKLREFCAEHPAATSPLDEWFKNVNRIKWSNFADVRETYRSADQVGIFTVFDIGGNKYRLIAEINYRGGKVFVRHVLTHAEYDKGKWKAG